MNPNDEIFDYVVVGGGSAGCIVAAELSANRQHRVLLVEAGPDAERHPTTLRAGGYKASFLNDALIEERFSTRDARWGGRRLFQGSGRGLGGGGSVNATVYTRGQKADWDEWPEGWRWSQVSGAFEALEARLRVKPRPPTRWAEACIAAAEDAGFRRSEDLNDGDLHGVLGYEAMGWDGEERRSSYVAFLRPARERPNLTLCTDARAERITFAERRATGVVLHQRGRTLRVRARREVVLCAGALETPRVLLRSGVGPEAALRRQGVPVIADAPEVGENLQDHPNIQLFYGGRGEVVDCEHPQLYGFHRALPESPLRQDAADTCYVFYPARSSFREGLMRLLPGMLLPEALYVPELRTLVRGGVAAAFRQAPVRRFVERLWGIVVILGKPLSRGRVFLDAIDPGWLTDPCDMEALVRGVGIARRAAASKAMAPWGQQELVPGPFGRSGAALERWIRLNAMTTYHYAGTCRMGMDARAVVDAELRLRGVQGVRVVDGSVIPVTPVGAMNAPSMLVGWRGAELLRAAATHSQPTVS